MLNLYKLEIFNTVAMEGSFSKAAGRLLLTQPAISQHIRDLEGSLGTVLFARTNRGVTLTPAGKILLDYTRCIMRLLAEAENAVKDLGQAASEQLTVGATPGAAVYLLPQWIQSFSERFPGAAISVKTDTTAQIAGELLAGRVNLGFVEGEWKAAPPLAALALREIELFVVVPARHPWAEQEAVAISALDGQPFVARPTGSQTRSWTDLVFAQYAVTPRIVGEFDHPETIKQAVASGLGITILPEWGIVEEAGSRIRALRLEGVELRRTLKLLWNETLPPQGLARAFLAHLVEWFPQLAQSGIVLAVPSVELPSRKAYRTSLGCQES